MHNLKVDNLAWFLAWHFFFHIALTRPLPREKAPFRVREALRKSALA